MADNKKKVKKVSKAQGVSAGHAPEPWRVLFQGQRQPVQERMAQYPGTDPMENRNQAMIDMVYQKNPGQMPISNSAASASLPVAPMPITMPGQPPVAEQNAVANSNLRQALLQLMGRNSDLRSLEGAKPD